jgi:uracil-DNA glycosylase
MAIEQWLPPAPLSELVGHRFTVDGRTVVPLPHPSGASSWANAQANRDLIAVAVGHIAALIRHPA